MHKGRSIRQAIAVAILMAMTVTLAGCGGGYKMPTRNPTTTKFQLTHHVGGTHYRVLAHEGRCIVAFGNSVQVIDPQSLMVINDVPLGEFGQCGPVVDLAIVNERLYAVIEDDGVAELSLPAGLAPKLREVISSQTLGILPRHLSVVDGVVYVSGVGGVVNFDAAKKIYSSNEECGSVAQTADGLAVCVGRRVNLIDGGRFIGAASDLQNLPESAQSDTPARLAYILRSQQNALAGIMTPDVREIAGIKSTIGMEGGVRRVRVLGNQLYFIGTSRIDWYELAASGLVYGGTIDILGALDIDRLDERTLVIVGTSGRAIYLLDDSSVGGRFVAAQREASGLKLATGDGLNILAGGKEGAWMYLVNSRAELTKRTIESAPPGPRSASVMDAMATILSDSQVIEIIPSAGSTTVQPWEYRVEKGAKIHTVIAVDGDFWIGHDRGITILRADGGQSLIDPQMVAKAQKDPTLPMPVANPVRDQLRFPGPVLYLIPLLAGTGATYVSENGGFGVARYIEVEQPGPPVKSK